MSMGDMDGVQRGSKDVMGGECASKGSIDTMGMGVCMMVAWMVHMY